MTSEEKARMGRPPLPAEQLKVSGTIRLNKSRWAKLRRLGGDWLDRAIDKAKEPAPKE